jgi:hypothetical protein
MGPIPTPDPLTVAIIVERDAAARILELADSVHVWAVDTAANRRAAEEVWARRMGKEPELSMTVFQFDEGAPDRVVAAALDAIDLHHDERSQVVAWSRALVFGAAPSVALLDALRGFGFDEIVVTETGFRASRKGRQAG